MMKTLRLTLRVACLLPLAGCGLPHGNLGMPDTSGAPGFGNSAFNGKDYPDPNPHSASDDAQRAAYQENQQRQLEAAQPSVPADPGPMNCTGSSVSSSGVNAGTFSSHTSCHN